MNDLMTIYATFFFGYSTKMTKLANVKQHMKFMPFMGKLRLLIRPVDIG